MPAQQAAPAGEPAEGSLDHSATREHDEALLPFAAYHDTVAHAVQVRPLLAALSRERAVEDDLAQARPLGFARVRCGQGVAVLPGGRPDGDCQPVAVGIDQRHALAPQHLLARVEAARTANGQALDRLRVDDAQPRRPPAPDRATP